MIGGEENKNPAPAWMRPDVNLDNDPTNRNADNDDDPGFDQ